MSDDEPLYPLNPRTFYESWYFLGYSTTTILTTETPVMTTWARNDLAGGNGTATQRATSCVTQFVGASNKGDVRLMGLGVFVGLLVLVLGLL
jgi:hypothetical protein